MEYSPGLWIRFDRPLVPLFPLLLFLFFLLFFWYSCAPLSTKHPLFKSSPLLFLFLDFSAGFLATKQHSRKISFFPLTVHRKISGKRKNGPLNNPFLCFFFRLTCLRTWPKKKKDTRRRSKAVLGFHFHSIEELRLLLEDIVFKGELYWIALGLESYFGEIIIPGTWLNKSLTLLF